ncbi:hypothetical protein [Succinimonas amylolytica]|uniref:hypothetical protein n=2 Tax=Succinimonas amylolytica TaxID=83769 RepID=UPI0003693E11|nr:hypothetical protein [Succinimonas amylolytica]
MRHLLKIQKIFLIAAILSAFGIGIKLFFIPFEGYDIKITETFMILWVVFSMLQISVPPQKSHITAKCFGYSSMVFSALAGFSAICSVWEFKSDISGLLFENLLNLSVGSCLIKLALSTSKVLYTVFGDLLRFLAITATLVMTTSLCIFINLTEIPEILVRITAISTFFATGCNLMLFKTFVTEYGNLRKKDQLVLIKTNQKGVYIDLFGNIMHVSGISSSPDYSENTPEIVKR